MLFLTHWKLNEDLSQRKTNDIAVRLTEDGLFPPEDVELVRWDGTPDGWGIVLWEAESFESINNAINMWRAAADDTAFFESTTTAPAAPIAEIVPQQAAFLDRLQ